MYFVVIETCASLSKTLQIFNSINTTGLDLNGGDIFKLRMYEYLRDKRKYDDEKDKPFEKISELYEKIDANNKKLGWVTNIHDILQIYKYVLITKYNLPKGLYFYATDKFYEELFDTLSNTNRWENFKNLDKDFKLFLEDLDEIIHTRYLWFSLTHKAINENGVIKHEENFPTAEDACSWHFIWWSRYSRYHILAYIFLNKFYKEEDYQSKLFLFNKQLSKLFIIYSIRFQKLKSDIYYGFMYEVLTAIHNKTSDEVIYLINSKIGKLENHKDQPWYDLVNILNGGINYNSLLKGIVCRLSAMLDEDYTSTNKSIPDKLFRSHIDIEHIQSYHDINGEKRDDIWAEWGEDINSLGNLVVLEQRINRSISNKAFIDKKVGYDNSLYASIKNIIHYHASWDLNACRTRKQKEVTKIINYLFN